MNYGMINWILIEILIIFTKFKTINSGLMNWLGNQYN
jgi:hypothetical protein